MDAVINNKSPVVDAVINNKSSVVDVVINNKPSVVDAVVNNKLPVVDVVVINTTGALKGVIGQLGGCYPKYEGDYEVTPSMSNNITLNTSNKVMRNDITVKKVSQLEVDNTSGGTTLIIGG